MGELPLRADRDLTTEKSSGSKTRLAAIVAVFAALAVVLNIVPIRVPAPYAPFLIYEIWEIPIVVAFLLFGPRVCLTVALVNYVTLQIGFPGALPSGPVYNLAAVLGMLSGVILAQKLFKTHTRFRVGVALGTGFGGVIRVAIMTVVNYLLLPMPYPVGFSLPVPAVLAVLPLVGVFNLTVALYTVPIAHLVSKAVSRGMRIAAWAYV